MGTAPVANAYSAPDSAFDYVVEAGSSALIHRNNLMVIPQTGAFSVEAWIHPDRVTNDWQAIFVQDQSNGGLSDGRFWFGLAANMQFHVGIGNSTVNSTSTLQTGSWKHVAVTIDASNNIIIYVDGIVFYSSTINNAITRKTGNYGGFAVGTNTGGGHQFDGRIDQAKIWNGALTADQVSQSMRVYDSSGITGPTLRAHYSFNDSSLSTLIDKVAGNYTLDISKSGQSNFVTSTYSTMLDLNSKIDSPNSTTWLDRAIGGVNISTTSGATFPEWNSTGRYFSFSSGSQIYKNVSYDNPTTFSIEIWFRTYQSGSKIIGFQNTAGTGASATKYDRHIYVNTDGKLSFGLYQNSIASIVSSDSAVNDGAWHHAVATYRGESAILYLDGVAKTATVNSSSQNYSGYWVIGGGNLNNWEKATNGGAGWIGDLAVAKVYKSVLSSQQVTDARNSITALSATLPSISNQPQSIGKTVGQSASFSVSASRSDSGTLTYQWQKNGSDIANATSSTYSIPTVSMGDAGEYRVVVTNSKDGTTATLNSNSATLTVSSALSMVTPNSGLAVTWGQAYSLSLSASGGAAPKTYSITGTLPTGLSLNSNTGVISGTSTALGSQTITATVTDGNSATATTSNFTLTVSCPTNQSITTTNLILHLDAGSACSTSGTAGAWRDISGNSRNLTWNNAPTLTNTNGGFYDFNRSSSHFGTFGSDGLSDFTNGFTISFYARFDATNPIDASSGIWERIIDIGNGNESDNIFVGRYWNTNRLILSFFRGNTWGSECISNSAIISSGTWHHYTITLSSSGTCTIYRDNVVQASTRNTNGGGAFQLPNNITRSNNYVGESNWVADAYFDGGIGDLAIYNRALTSAEVAANFSSQAENMTITYEYNSADGGNSTISSNFVAGGTGITLPTPTRSGYTFGGWFEASNFSASAVTSPYSPTQTRTVYAKWNQVVNGSFRFSGSTNSYLTIANSNDFKFGTGNFTIEWWQYQTDNSLYTRIFEALNNSTREIGVSIESNNFYWWNPSGALCRQSLGGTAASNKNTWIHFLVSRSGSTTKVFKNGSELCSFTDNTNYQPNSALTIGAESARSSTTFYGGDITNFHWVKGTALQTSNFTTRYSPVPIDTNSKLLLNAQNQATFLTDLTGLKSVSNNGNNVIWSTNSPFSNLSTDATLSNLSISSATLSPSFSAGTRTYTASVLNSSSSITVTPTRNHQSATITVNGSSVTSGNASGSISLNVGSNSISVVVTAQDGASTSTYTITVTRAALGTALTPTFGSSTSTTGGFTVQISNYDSNYSWSGSATAGGSVSISNTGLVSVTGLASNTSSTATITTARSEYATGSANVTATSLVVTFTISYNANSATSGSAPANGSYTTGGSAATIATNSGTLARTGYTFAGWNTASDGSGTDYAASGSATYSTSANLTLYAKWTANPVITFNSNGGSGTMNSQSTGSGGAVTIANNAFTRSGFSFVEWTTSSNGSGTAYVNGQSATISQDVTLYAQWTKIRTDNLQINLDATNLQSLTANSTTWKGVRPGTSTSSQNKAGGVTYDATNNIVSLTFDGDADYYSYSTVADSRTTGAISFEMWINPGNLRNGWNILATRWFSDTSGGAVSSNDWHFAIRNNNNLGLRLNLYTTGSSDKYGSRIFASSDDWMLVGFTIDASGNLKFYVNGVQDGSTHTGISRTNQSGSKFFIGDPRANMGFPGGISKVRLYGAALSSAEMLANFDAEYLYYRLNKVTFNENYGATPANTAQYLARSTATNLTANGFTRATYNFNGWNTEADGSGTNYTNSQSVTLTEDLTLYAKWATATYTVTYDSQGGTPIASGTFVQGGSISSSPGTPVRAGYTFNGWFAAATGGSALTFAYSPGVNQAITLYAQWSVNTYTVTYDSQSGSAISSGSYTTGGNIPTSPGNPTRSGYTFNGWFLASTGGTALTFPYTPGLTRDITIYAQWTAINYNITYSSNEASSGSVPSDASNYTIGQKITVKANTGNLVRTGYTFAGWNTAANGGGTTYLSGTEYTVGSANVTLYAKWSANTYTITYNTNGASGAAQRSSSNVTSDSYTTGGSTITLPGVGTMAKTGFDFGGWSETTSGAAVSDNLTTSSSKTLYAIWTAKTIQVTYSKGDAASHNFTNFPSNTTGTYGAIFTLNGTLDTTATFNISGVATLHQFVGWNDGNSVFTAGASYSLGENSQTFTALWVPVYGVRYNFNGGTAAAGTSTVDGECLGAGSLCTNNQTITANAAPSRTGYTFDGWKLQDDSTVAAGAQFTVISTRYILSAQWIPVDYTVTYNPNSGATTPTQASRQIGQTFTVANAISRTGYSFNGWSDGTRNYGPGANYTVGSANVTLTAQWIADVYTITYDWNGGRGSAEADASYTVGTGALTLPLVGDRVKDGYTFSGWSLTSNGDLVGLTYTPTQSRTLYAIWGTGSFTLTYNANGGSNAGGVNSAQIQNGNAATLPTPTRANFVFDGWYSASTGGALLGAAGASYQPTQSRSIYARWTQASLAGISPSALTRIGTTTTSDGVSTSFSGANASSAVSINIPSGALPAGTVVNFDLVGDVSRARAAISNANSYIVSIVVSWLASDGSVPDTAVGKPIAVTIQNAAIKAGASIYKIIFQNGESVPTLLGTATQDGIITVNITTDPEVVVAVTKPGAPTGVSASSNGNLQSIVAWSAPTSNGGAPITTYTATTNTGQSCQTANLTCTITGLSAGTAYTFTVTATNAQGTSDASSTASATTASNYTVTFNSNGGSVVANGEFLTGGSVTAPTNPTRSGYTFAGWSDTDGGSAVLFDYSPGVTQNITLYAIWTANSYVVTFNSNHGSSVTASSFATGGTVSEPTAPTRSGYTFAGWSATDGGAAITFPYSPGVTNNITLYAKWTGDSFTVTFNSNNGSSVTASSFTTGGTVSEPTAPTRSGYTFAGWSATDGGSAISFPYSPNVTAPITLYAKWTAVQSQSSGNNNNNGGGSNNSNNGNNSNNSGESSSGSSNNANTPAAPAVIKLKPVEVVGSTQAKVPTIELPIKEKVTNNGTTVITTVKVAKIDEKYTESVKIVNNQLTIVPVEGFSGKRNISVTVTEGTEVKTVEIPLVVLPEQVKAPVVTPTSSRKTTIDWKASPNADKYEVFVDGKKVCSTEKTECSINQLIGPKSVVEIVSNGGDRTKSEAKPADFEQDKPIQVVQLAGSSRIKPTISASDKAGLDKVIALIKKQGFGTVVISNVTYTKSSKAASEKRLDAIKKYIEENIGKNEVDFVVKEPSKKTFINTVSLDS